MRLAQLSVLYLVLSLLLLFPCTSLARIQISDGSEDLRDLFSSADFVFHGRIVTIESDGKNNDLHKEVANIEVDRWYKGRQPCGRCECNSFTAGILATAICALIFTEVRLG